MRKGKDKRKWLISLLCAVVFVFNITPIFATENNVNDIAVSDLNASFKYKFSHLQNVDQRDMLIFTYLGMDKYDDITVSVESQNGKSYVKYLSEENTSAEFDEISLNEIYTYAIQADGESLESGI